MLGASEASEASGAPGAPGATGAPGVPGTGLGRPADWAELLRISALFTVPGDALAGAAAVGLHPNRRTLTALCASLCLYEAGMALNDWADREEDAVERPHRPLPSGRIAPAAALTAAGALTVAGLGLAARAGRPALTAATALAGTVWAYDLHLKHTPAGPAAMATARGLDLLLGATATWGPGSRNRSRNWNWNRGSARGAGPVTGVRAALPASALLAAHTLAVTAVSRREAQGGSSAIPLGALAATVVLGAVVGRGPERGPAAALGLPAALTAHRSAPQLLGAAYIATAARPLLHAALNPSPQLTQRAVGGGIRAMIPLQAALAARAGSLGTALATAALAPLARRLARKVSAT
ncbi:SCO3242 family prenyltransferase [Streptomyces monticola]|uniref:SCO3242 family prenyltransferase n=1 Tax=Streptomyces monticola TaxID=2666263 RepID=A0ABW2JCF3_9ACTN